MFKTLKSIFDDNITKLSEPSNEKHSLELASAALLFEISRADEDISKIEKHEIASALRRVFSLEEQELQNLLGAADSTVSEAVSLYEFTDVLNEKFDREQKIKLIEMLWRVAFADDTLDKHEEYYVRKIAELLHVSHKDYIKTKLRVQEGA